MKNSSRYFDKYKYRSIVIIVSLAISLIFVALLVYFDSTPAALINSITKKFNDAPEIFEDSDSYSYKEPIDQLETMQLILSTLNDSDYKLLPPVNIGTDITNRFISYVDNSNDFNSLSKLVTTWDNKYLAFSQGRLFLYQVINKKLYMRSLEINGVINIRFAFIFRSGNILFCDSQNAYYSHDNLLTYHKSKILDAGGNQYLPNEHGNFFSLGIDGRQVIDGKEIRVWGNYTNYGDWHPGVERSEQIQVWYTTDEGKTIKSAYKFGYTEPKLVCRHIHVVNMCPWDNSFWVQTGDMNDECHWIQGEYNWDTDTWKWKVRVTGDHMSFYKSTGFVFYNSYIYWSDDSSDPSKHGIWRTSYSNLLNDQIDADKFENILKTDKEIAKLVGNDQGFMIASQYFKSEDNNYKIFITSDGGQSWQTINTTFQIINIHLPNNFNQILGNYFINQDTFEAIHFWDFGPSIFINSYLKDSI